MEYIIQDSTLQGIADAIRSKTGDTAPIQTDAFANAISLIETGGGGDTSIEDGLIEGTLTEYTNSRVTIVTPSAFRKFTKLTRISFPNVTQVGESAFMSCSALESVNLPSAVYIGASNASSAFYGCKKLKSISLPVATRIDKLTFGSCNALESVDLPSATNLGENVFEGCTSLKNLVFPKVVNIAREAFSGCHNLESVDLSACQALGYAIFSNCYSFKTLILRADTMASYTSTIHSNCYHFNGKVNSTYNPEGLTDGYIYVPSALVDTYKAGSGWSTYAAQVRALEDYTVDGTITGELDPNKI